LAQVSQFGAFVRRRAATVSRSMATTAEYDRWWKRAVMRERRAGGQLQQRPRVQQGELGVSDEVLASPRTRRTVLHPDGKPLRQVPNFDPGRPVSHGSTRPSECPSSLAQSIPGDPGYIVFKGQVYKATDDYVVQDNVAYSARSGESRVLSVKSSRLGSAVSNRTGSAQCTGSGAGISTPRSGRSSAMMLSGAAQVGLRFTESAASSNRPLE